MKTLTYKRDDINKLVSLLNKVTVSGIEGCRTVSAIADILDTGIEGEIMEKKENGNDSPGEIGK